MHLTELFVGQVTKQFESLGQRQPSKDNIEEIKAECVAHLHRQHTYLQDNYLANAGLFTGYGTSALRDLNVHLDTTFLPALSSVSWRLSSGRGRRTLKKQRDLLPKAPG